MKITTLIAWGGFLLALVLCVAFGTTQRDQYRRIAALQAQVDSLGTELAKNKNTFVFVDVSQDSATFANRGSILARLDCLEARCDKADELGWRVEVVDWGAIRANAELKRRIHDLEVQVETILKMRQP